MSNRTCAFPECDKQPRTRGYCSGHYQQWLAGKELTPLRSYRRAPEDLRCSVAGCVRPYQYGGYCRMHGRRQERGQDVGGPAPLRARHTTIEELLERIGYTKRQVRPDLGPCWEWNGNLSPGGYGRITVMIGGKATYSAHRLSYARRYGPIEASKVVCHRCDNPPCINPAHLFLGTNKDNTQDALSKGRLAHGERVHSSRLTEDDVRDIRATYAAGRVSLRGLASKYGVSAQTINDTVRRKRWKHVV